MNSFKAQLVFHNFTACLFFSYYHRFKNSESTFWHYS